MGTKRRCTPAVSRPDSKSCHGYGSGRGIETTPAWSAKSRQLRTTAAPRTTLPNVATMATTNEVARPAYSIRASDFFNVWSYKHLAGYQLATQICYQLNHPQVGEPCTSDRFHVSEAYEWQKQS